MVGALITAITLLQWCLGLAAAVLVLWLVFLALPGFMAGPPFVGTPPARLRVMLELAQLKPGEVVFDLGSGDGRLLREAAAAGAAATGYEVNLFLVWRSRFNLARAGLGRRARVLWRSFWRADLSSADVVFIFGYSTIMARLEAKLQAELKPGARLVSYRYKLPSWPPAAERDHVYLYRRPG